MSPAFADFLPFLAHDLRLQRTHDKDNTSTIGALRSNVDYTKCDITIVMVAYVFLRGVYPIRNS